MYPDDAEEEKKHIIFPKSWLLQQLILKTSRLKSTVAEGSLGSLPWSILPLLDSLPRTPAKKSVNLRRFTVWLPPQAVSSRLHCRGHELLRTLSSKYLM